MDFTGKIAVITGGGGGIGCAVAKKFTDLGAKVALLDIKEEFARKTIDKLGLSGDQALCVAVDVTQEDQVKSAIAKVVERYGTLDYLIATAGIPGPSARVEDYSSAAAKKVFDVNIFGTFLMVSNCIRIMKEKKYGAIVTFGSCSGMCGYPYESAYGVSKAAMIQLARCAANENGGNGVRVNSISPGWVDTNMMKTVTQSYVDVGISNPDDNTTLGPMDRPADPAEIANACAFLCSDEASYINGCNLVSDGGMTLG